MTTIAVSSLRSVALCAASLFLIPTSFAQSASAAPAAASASDKVDRALREDGNWYASWGYSRQVYAPSDIHVSQPGLGNDFTVHQAAGSDFPATAQQTIEALGNFEFTLPQENVRVGKFLNPEKTFAIEFSLDHSKYQTDLGQVAQVSGMVNRQPYNANMVLVGTYSVAANFTYVSLKFVRTEDSRIIRAYDYTLPNDKDVTRLLQVAPASAR